VSIAEVEALADVMPERLRVLVLLASWCELRRGEVLGLQRQDLDAARGTVRIRRAVVHMLDGTMTIGRPKSEAGTRTVHYPSNPAPAIEDHLRRHVRDDPTAWLFAGTIDNPLAVKTLQRAWNSARPSIGARTSRCTTCATAAPLGGRLQGHDQGAHVPPGARHPRRCSARPARLRRAGQGPRRRPGGARRLGQGDPDRPTPSAPE
jgi:integrase